MEPKRPRRPGGELIRSATAAAGLAAIAAGCWIWSTALALVVVGSLGLGLAIAGELRAERSRIQRKGGK